MTGSRASVSNDDTSGYPLARLVAHPFAVWASHGITTCEGLPTDEPSGALALDDLGHDPVSRHVLRHALWTCQTATQWHARARR